MGLSVQGLRGTESSCPCLVGSLPLPESSDVRGLEACPVPLEVVNFLPEAWLPCPRVQVLVCTCVHTHTHTQTCTHTETCTHTHTHAGMHTQRDRHTYTDADTHAYTYTHADMHTHTETCMHAHTHTHVQTCRHTLQVHTSSHSPAPLLVGKGKAETLGP